MPGYLVEISDVFYQVTVDLRPDSVARAGANPYPHYDDALRMLERPPGRVLVVGSGTGNDVAAALRAGATQVDAVDIDPAIVALGRKHHPERPYDDGRVRITVADARAAFRTSRRASTTRSSSDCSTPPATRRAKAPATTGKDGVTTRGRRRWR